MYLLILPPLSTGQKARLVFSCITSQHPHILILDEPTNHLDFVTIDALKDAISTFLGGILLVSHDQALMECCEELYVIERRKVMKQAKVNPNQLKAAAVKAQKEIAQAAAKAKKNASAAASSSSSSMYEKLKFPSRCALRKLEVSFEEYRESIVDDM